MVRFSDIPQLARGIGRLVEVARVLARFGLADVLARLDARSVRRWIRGSRVEVLAEAAAPVRWRLALTELGTTFIKFGQVLSTRPDLIGPEWAEEFAALQQQVPADPFTVTRATIEAELGRPLEVLYAQFEPQPVASASIGQVHRAVLPDGRVVAVKVQHPGVERQIADDLVLLRELAVLAERYLPEWRIYRPTAVVAEFERTIRRELDFQRELRHLQLFRQAFAADPEVRFPEPYPSWSSRRVLTMEYLEGIPLSQAEPLQAAGADLGELARRGSHIFLQMIFRDGFFHADPHPGNVLYLPRSGAIGLLDVGMVGRIDRRLQERFAGMLAAVVQRDAAGLCEHLLAVAEAPPRFDRPAFEAEIAEQLDYYYGMPLEQFRLGTAINELIALFRRYHIVLPSHLALLLRVLAMLEGTGRRLAPQFNLLEVLEPYYRGMVRQRWSPRFWWRHWREMVQDWDELMHTLPRQANGLLRLWQRRGVEVQLMHRHLEPSVNRLVFGLMVSALFVGSSLLWAFAAPPLLGGVSIFGVLGWSLSLLLGFRLFRAIQHSGRLEEESEL